METDKQVSERRRREAVHVPLRQTSDPLAQLCHRSSTGTDWSSIVYLSRALSYVVAVRCVN